MQLISNLKIISIFLIKIYFNGANTLILNNQKNAKFTKIK